jgi:hypothetical protein
MGAMAGKANSADTITALTMLECFVATGADGFAVTSTNKQGEKISFRRAVDLDMIRSFLPAMLEGVTRDEQNLIVRPLSRRTVFIQLDDLNAGAMERVKPAAFLGLETSPGNYQAWVALDAGSCDRDFARRLRKGAGADDTASGATRVAGNFNFKQKYAPNFPRVEISHSAPSLFTSTSELEALGLVAPAEKAAPTVRITSPAPNDNRKWPSYLRSVQGAPENRDKSGPDISRADFTWCMTALTWGWTVEDTAVRLMEESGKARENGERYAVMTANNALAAVQRRQRSRA